MGAKNNEEPVDIQGWYECENCGKDVYVTPLGECPYCGAALAGGEV